MINLNTRSISKIDQLRNAIGKEFSDNYSNTNRSKLLAVSDNGLICTVVDVHTGQSEENNVIPNICFRKQPSYITWNGLFY
jgi:uncharacterized protein (UPF0218 family)